jgi:MoaA/NifB/PqqE/SkfB family radical SAM enzyme
MDWAEGPWLFMQPPVFHAVVDQLAEWQPRGVRFEIDGRGEPSFNKRLEEYLAYARSRYPKCQILMTSNGDTVQKYKDGYRDWIYHLLDLGLNFALLDCYTPERYADFRARFPEALRFFEDGASPYGYHGPKHRQIILLDAAPGNKNTIREYHSQGGTVNAEKARAAGFAIRTTDGHPLTRMCVRPFRELTVYADGTVPLCCNDWTPVNVRGNVLTDRLEDIWRAMDDARRVLLAKNRGGLKPCDRCTEHAGFRVGLEYAWFKDEPTLG